MNHFLTLTDIMRDSINSQCVITDGSMLCSTPSFHFVAYIRAFHEYGVIQLRLSDNLNVLCVCWQKQRTAFKRKCAIFGFPVSRGCAEARIR